MSNKVVLASALVAALSLLVQRGVAQDSPPFHRGPWPIHNGFNYQPTQNKLRGLHHQDVRPDEAREIDRLYDPLRSRSEKHSASLSRKRRDPHDRQRQSEAECTRINEGCIGGETQTITTIPKAKEISADVAFDVSLSLEERAEIWRALGQHATVTSIPAGLRVGEVVPNTAHFLSFSNDLRQKVPTILRFYYTLLHDQVLIVDPQSKVIVSIVARWEPHEPAEVRTTHTVTP
jgi:hypothetical protein